MLPPIDPSGGRRGLLRDSSSRRVGNEHDMPMQNARDVMPIEQGRKPRLRLLKHVGGEALPPLPPQSSMLPPLAAQMNTPNGDPRSAAERDVGRRPRSSEGQSLRLFKRRPSGNKSNSVGPSAHEEAAAPVMVNKAIPGSPSEVEQAQMKSRIHEYRKQERRKAKMEAERREQEELERQERAQKVNPKLEAYRKELGRKAAEAHRKEREEREAEQAVEEQRESARRNRINRVRRAANGEEPDDAAEAEPIPGVSSPSGAAPAGAANVREGRSKRRQPPSGRENDGSRRERKSSPQRSAPNARKHEAAPSSEAPQNAGYPSSPSGGSAAHTSVEAGEKAVEDAKKVCAEGLMAGLSDGGLDEVIQNIVAAPENATSPKAPEASQPIECGADADDSHAQAPEASQPIESGADDSHTQVSDSAPPAPSTDAANDSAQQLEVGADDALPAEAGADQQEPVA